jgi:hypothetical protein
MGTVWLLLAVVAAIGVLMILAGVVAALIYFTRRNERPRSPEDEDD